MTITATRTELDKHRELNTDHAAVKSVKARIAEAGVEYLYYQIVTLTGRVVGKVVPARHLMRNVENGIQAHPGVVADLQADSSGALVGGSPERGECVVLPDLDSFGVLPWDHRTGFFFCRMYEPDHAPDGAGGRPVPVDVRGNLHRTHAGFTERTGLVMRSGCEPEVSWRMPGLSTEHRPGTPHSMYHIGQMEQLRPVYQRVMEYGRALGLDMVESNCEDPGQLELNWAYDLAERTADRLILHRQICRQVAREMGATASFMPKPEDDKLGNGCHHNVSFWRGEHNVLADPDNPDLHLTETGKHALGGILTHAAAFTAVMAPTVNSYKRYCHTGQFAPLEINWGMDNKTCAVRLPASGRLEVKSPDSLVNPYLSHAVLLAAAEDGLTQGIDPGPPRRAGTEPLPGPFGSLPLTLKEALDLFAGDRAVTRGLGPEMADMFLRLKTLEWERFCGAVTDWERMMYDGDGC
ncbi:glutamine synthetase family protein [Streptomyces boncukensis]|uniref:Glutamine synthetase n=1 Tax=Streptomyces boncukensis TaxID=2711219 RepID=A0A6G4WYW5_9ACTN|nr:glutamine synthetase family protein [Streptomyces boncukensis]NGO70052.1 glutamine synthetase [Streptomyces boncukensis]